MSRCLEKSGWLACGWMKIDPSHGRFHTCSVLEHRSLLSQKSFEGLIVMLGVTNRSQNNFIPMIIIPGSPRSFTRSHVVNSGLTFYRVTTSRIGHRKLQRGLHVQSKTIFNFFLPHFLYSFWHFNRQNALETLNLLFQQNVATGFTYMLAGGLGY